MSLISLPIYKVYRISLGLSQLWKISIFSCFVLEWILKKTAVFLIKLADMKFFLPVKSCSRLDKLHISEELNISTLTDKDITTKNIYSIIFECLQIVNVGVNTSAEWCGMMFLALPKAALYWTNQNIREELNKSTFIKIVNQYRRQSFTGFFQCVDV